MTRIKKIKKILAGICGILMLTPAISTNLYAFAENPDADQLPADFWYYKGDLNQDISVGVADVILMQKYLLGLEQITEEQFQIGDLDSDGIINIYDFVLLKRVVLSGEWTMIRQDSQGEQDASDLFISAPIAEIGASLPSQGNANLVIFYVDFPDCPYTYEPTEEELTEIAFGNPDAENVNYPFESFSAFYGRSSKNTMQLSGKVFRYTTKENQSAYDTDKAKLARECYAAFEDTIDFSQFDGDGDSVIDATLFNVPEQAGEENWWPCAGDSGIYDYMPDDVRIGYIITGNAQINSATDYKNFTSSYLHEMGHCMGLPDYYLYYSEDFEGFHGETDTAGTELMDTDASTDFCCFSKLMLGWYKESQIAVYDPVQGGEQKFILQNAQTDAGNCLILPYGDFNNYTSEYIILEYITPEANNSSSIYPWVTVADGIRAYHVKADIYDNGWWKHFTFENGSEFTNEDDEGIRLIRLVNDLEGGDVFRTGDILDGNISGFHWYADDESESIDTGYTVTIGACENDQYEITVIKN